MNPPPLRARPPSIAGGMDHLYPPENADLQRAIASEGLLITEMPIGTSPRAEHFPRRNRIISGMSRAVSLWKRHALRLADHRALCQ